jgi:hypothetical protein
LPGPVYIQCHHGKDRGPGAAVAANLCLDVQHSVQEAEALLKRAGTDRRYTGLVGLPRSLIRPTPEELDRVATDFPEVAIVSDLAQHLVEIEARFDDLKVVKKSDWQPPLEHPDIDPSHEALMLAEHYREARPCNGNACSRAVRKLGEGIGRSYPRGVG